jgi:hypothetical protein
MLARVNPVSVNPVRVKPKKVPAERRSNLTEEILRGVIERLKYSSINQEAQRLKCYHATLRKQLRRLLGEEGYNALPIVRGAASETTEEDLRTAIEHLNDGSILESEARRLSVRAATLQYRIRRLVPDFVVPKRGQKALAELSPGSCPHDGASLSSGTDGNGHVFMWCPRCSYDERVAQRRAPQRELTTGEQREVIGELDHDALDRLRAELEEGKDAFDAACRMLGLSNYDLRLSLRKRLQGTGNRDAVGLSDGR